MRIPLMPRVCSVLLCGLLTLLAGCSNPSSQTLDSLTVTATPATLSIGGAAVLKAMAHLSDGTTQDVTSGTQWTLSNPALATMSNSALTATAAGTLTVQAAYVETTPAGTSPSAASTSTQNLSASTQITITATPSTNTPSITWSTPAAITYGTALGSTQLNATANLPGTFVYTPAAGALLKAGTQTLSVVFTPTDTQTYSSETATVALNVAQANPVVTWAAPATIQAGTALSATQLNATASVPGTFLYNPAAGAVLAAGVQALTATFSPTDLTDYASATAHNSLTVASGSPAPTPTPSPTPSPSPSPTPSPTSCGGPTVNLNSGMSQSTLQGTISSAPDCSLIVFTAGTYNITAQISIPCPKTGLTITGPGVAWPGPYTATLNGSVAGNWGFSYGPCSAAVTIEYLNWNGGEPSAGGGGFLYVSPGSSNLTVEYNWIHGNQANITANPGATCATAGNNVPCPGESHLYDDLIYFDGTDTDPASNYDNNDTISWNTFGASNDGTATNADCGNIAQLFYYQETDYAGDAGFCNAVGLHSSTTNLAINNNIIQFQEEGIKAYEGGSTASSFFYQTNASFSYNDFNFIHRCPIESQQSPGYPAAANYNYNDIRNTYYPAWASFGFSMPQQLVANCNDNVMLENPQYQVPGYPYGGPGAFEFWGNGNCNNNLIQGIWNGGVGYGFDQGSPLTWSVSYNIIQLTLQTDYITNEEGITCCYPGQTGNITGKAVSAVTSAAPTISPTPTGTYSAPISVTLTDTGVTNGGAGPQGNTTIYYTTDGSTPTTASTVCNPAPASTSCTISVSPGATVNAIAMWGSINQPKSYPAGYGFVPSAVVTASYSTGSSIRRPVGGVSSAPGSRETQTGNATTAVASSVPGTAALQSVAIVPSAPAVAIGATTQLKAIATLTDGSTKDVTSGFTWKSSDMRTIAVSSSGVLSGLASGQAVLSGAYQGLTTSVLASSSVGEIAWSGPIVITQGGAYSGNWQSTDGKTAAVTVATDAPVIIQDSHIRSSSNLIQVNMDGADLTVRNTLGLALHASVKGQPNGVFLDAASPARLDVENNYMENVRYGVLVHGYTGSRTEKQTLVIRGNRARNLNGLLSDGVGGYLPGEGANRSLSRFVELDDLQSVPGVDVGWNEVVDYPAHSLVSDVIDVYRSSGTANQPLEIHDSYIQGAYPYNPAQDAYHGGGIKTDGGADDTAQNASAFTYIHNNQVVGTVSYGIAFTAGHDNIAADNRVISSGLLRDGTKIAAQQVGLSNADAHGNMERGSIYNNTMHDNVVGWTCWTASCAEVGYRQDQYFPASTGDYESNSVVPARQITLDMEESEFLIWLNKTESAGIKVGPSF